MSRDSTRLLEAQRPYVARAVRRFGKMVAGSAAMHEVFDLLACFASSEITVTLIGETGTGKDVLAQTLHRESPRAAGPFVVFDCGAVVANLAESELFGHERGAFTGAVSARAGAFERAHGGTLFLDEIGELSLDLQPRLLRALENRSVRRVGGTRERLLDVRIIAATHRDLEGAVAAGQFRQDLYFRLAAAVVNVPPLRARLEDLPLLVPRLLQDLGGGHLCATDDTFAALASHAWPGNVRELKNALACALAFAETDARTLEPQHLRLLPPAPEEESGVDRPALSGRTLEQIERAAVRQTLARTDGDKNRAAEILGIPIAKLYEKLKKHGL